VTLAQAAVPLGAGAAYDALGRYDPILWILAARIGGNLGDVIGEGRSSSMQHLGSPWLHYGLLERHSFCRPYETFIGHRKKDLVEYLKSI
jgi:hypothetical protein